MWSMLPDDVLDLVAAHSNYKVASVNKDLRRRYYKYCRAQIAALFPSFLHMALEPIRDLHALQNLRMVPVKYSYKRYNMFELFLVSGSHHASFLFPCTFGFCIAWNRQMGLHSLYLYNAPAFFAVFDHISNENYVVLIEYDAVLQVHVLDVFTGIWSMNVLQFGNLTYVHVFWATDTMCYLIVFEHMLATIMTMDCTSGKINILGTISAPSDCSLSHAGKYIVGYVNDPDLFIPVRTKIGWMKYFNTTTMKYEDIAMPAKQTKGFYQMFEFGDFLMFFIDKFRKLACLHQLKWLPDIELPVMGLPPWNCWSVMEDSLIIWDIWTDHIDVIEYNIFRRIRHDTTVPPDSDSTGNT